MVITTTPEQSGKVEPRPIISALAPFYANFAREISYPLIRVTVGGTLLVHGVNRAMIPLSRAAEEMTGTNRLFSSRSLLS